MARNRRRRRDDSTAAEDSNLAAPEALPEELRHADPDAELAQAQLALGRPELSERPSPAELDEYVAEADAGGSGRGGRGGRGHAASTDLVEPQGPSHGAKPSLISRTVGFFRGSWHELHRVQWPDRQQVFQATGVVLGFVIVAGIFLAVADLAASKLVHLILK